MSDGFVPLSGLLVPFGPCQKELALRRNLVVAKSALLRFRPRAAKTALRFLAPPLPTEPASLGFGGGPEKGLPAPAGTGGGPVVVLLGAAAGRGSYFFIPRFFLIQGSNLKPYERQNIK